MHYDTELDAVSDYILFANAPSPGQGLRAASAPRSGDWSATGDFFFVALVGDWDAPVSAVGYPDGYWRYQMVTDEVESVMDGIAIPQRLGRPRTRLKKLAADKGYSVPRVGDRLRARGIKPVIPYKSNEAACYDGRVKFDRPAYRRRAVVARCVGWMKESRRIGIRFEKLAVNFHGRFNWR